MLYEINKEGSLNREGYGRKLLELAGAENAGDPEQRCMRLSQMEERCMPIPGGGKSRGEKNSKISENNKRERLGRGGGGMFIKSLEVLKRKRTPGPLTKSEQLNGGEAVLHSR